MEIHVQMNSADSILLLGHNPGMEELAIYLTGSGERDLIERMSSKFPTAALAVLQCRADRWSELTRGSCELVEFVRPRDL